MLKPLTILTTFSICIISLLSCNSIDTELLHKIDSDKILSERYSIEGNSGFYWEKEKAEFKYYPDWINKSNDLQLDTLEFGYKDLQIRVWLGHSLAVKRHIVIIKRIKGEWDGLLIIMTYNDSLNKPNVEMKSVSPKSGWNRLLTQLNKLEIFTLEDSNSLPGYDGLGGADGISYDFEIATPTKYRRYIYGSLEGYDNKYRQVNNVQQISEILEKEFDFKITR